MVTNEVINFFSLPAEIRNEIYNLVWTHVATLPSSSLAEALLLDAVPKQDNSQWLSPLLTCRRMREEAELLALSRTTFQITGKTVLPDAFYSRIAVLSPPQVSAIRTLTLTARVAHLRAMNEAWEGSPFGSRCLKLDRLIIIPQKPDASGSCYAEVADLSQCHTLAYVLGETLKGLRHVRVVEVQNQGCFNEIVWRLLYRCLVYKMWKWGGIECGLTFSCSDAKLDGCGDEWFKVFIDQSAGNEVGLEVCRLMGKQGQDPDLFI